MLTIPEEGDRVRVRPWNDRGWASTGVVDHVATAPDGSSVTIVCDDDVTRVIYLWSDERYHHINDRVDVLVDVDLSGLDVEA